MTPIEKFKAHLKTTLIGRDLEVDLCTLALVAGEHAFLEGPPGTGKSQLINNFIKATQAKGFTLLMSPFTMPEEVFGPFMLSALQKDRYLRNLTDRICEAELVFLDEAFKSSGATLNSLLTIMQERMFDNDGKRIKCPLRSLFAASNEMPDPDANLGALYDRFALRTRVNPIPQSMHRQLWFGKMPPVKSVCTMSDFETAGQTAEAMPWSSDAQDVFEKIVYAIRDDLHITLGDRRTRKAVGICQASAAIAGGHEVRPHHLECLRFMFWESPDQIEAVASLVMRESNPDQMILEEFMKEIEAIRNDMPDKASDASPLLIKVKEMNARMAAMQQSRMRDTLLKESRPLETKLLAITTGQSLALVEKLMKAQQNAKAALPPLPV